MYMSITLTMLQFGKSNTYRYNRCPYTHVNAPGSALVPSRSKLELCFNPAGISPTKRLARREAFA